MLDREAAAWLAGPLARWPAGPLAALGREVRRTLQPVCMLLHQRANVSGALHIRVWWTESSMCRQSALHT